MLVKRRETPQEVCTPSRPKETPSWRGSVHAGGEGAAGLQELHHGCPPVEPGQVVGGGPPLVLVAHLALGARQQQLHHPHMPLLGRQVQGQVAVVVLNVNIGFELQQSLQSVQKPLPGYVVDDSEAGTVFQVGVGPVTEQPPGDFGVPEFHHLRKREENWMPRVEVCSSPASRPHFSSLAFVRVQFSFKADRGDSLQN